MADRPLTDWNTGLCDCCEDAATCCYGFWCCPCMACSVSSKFGENYCLPLCDILTPGVFAGCGIPLVVPPAALSLRAGMRNRYNIRGSFCRDIAVSCFCLVCSWCQMHRELKQRKRDPAVITIHAPNLVNTQPGPVLVLR